MAFESIIGHTFQKQQLTKLLLNPPTCFLFSGESGIGKKTFAKEIACELNHLKIKPENFPDLHLVGPEEGENVFSIEKVRGIIEKSYLKPAVGPQKVFILDEIEKLSPGGGEALLKLLEEPPENTLYILITSNLEKLLPTIQSRTILVNFFPLADHEVKQYLDLQKITQNQELIIRLANGSLQRVNAIQQQNLLEVRNKLYELFKTLGKSYRSNFTRIDKYPFPEEWEDKQKVITLLYFLKTFYYDSLNHYFNLDLTPLPFKNIAESLNIIYRLETNLTIHINLKAHFISTLLELYQLEL